MGFRSGERVGRYEILSPLGSGGMGEVWRARDPHIGRDVAIKTLLPELAADAGLLARFGAEARAAGSLSHPNVLAIHDVGASDGVPYLVEELVEGESLREALASGPLAPRRAVEVAAQVARGLAAAHAAGLVHRDLKPENVLIGKRGAAKIADFGLAKVARGRGPRTESGIVLGSAGYMSPEQVRGEAVDGRTDLFALGAILYEMLTGRRAFDAPTGAEAMTAVLKSEPEGLDALPGPPALAAIVRRCLEKPADERFQSARDLAFALETLASRPGGVAPMPTRSRRSLLAWAAALAVAALAGGALLARRRADPPLFHQLTFRRGQVRAARFTPDGGAVVYAAAWEGAPARTFAMRPERPESREVGPPGTELLAVSRRGELLVTRGRRYVQLWSAAGTLARLPLEGGEARDVAEEVSEADWAPDGEGICVVRTVAGRCRVEYPPGRPLYSTSGYVSHVRFSPDGTRIAFLDHPTAGDDAGAAAVIDLSGKKTLLAGGWLSASGLAWRPDGREVWFTATTAGAKQALHAVTLSGRLRTVASVPGTLTLHDVSASGRVLLALDTYRLGVRAGTRGGSERDLTWLDWSHVRDLAPDGRTILFDETAEGGGPEGSVYLRRLDGSTPVRLGEGTARALSSDGKWALANLSAVPKQLFLLPTGAGPREAVTADAIHHVRARFFPGGERILFAGNAPGRGTRLWVQHVKGRDPRAISPEGIGPAEAVSPDGASVAAIDPAGALVLYPVAGGAPREVPGRVRGDLPLAFAADGRALFVREGSGLPARVARLDLGTGARAPWLALAPEDAAGVDAVTDALVTPDGTGYAYCFSRILSELFVVDGLR